MKIPEGWPTVGMIEAAHKAYWDTPNDTDSRKKIRAALKDALAAAPTPPAQGAIKLDADDLKDDFGLMSNRDMLNYLHSAFETEVHNCENCGFAEPTSTFDSANILRDYLEANPTPLTQEAEPVGYITPLYLTRNEESAPIFKTKKWDWQVPLYNAPQSEELRQAAGRVVRCWRSENWTEGMPNLHACLADLAAVLDRWPTTPALEKK